MKPFIVGGTFDAKGGHPSKIVGKLAEHLKWPVLNGGTLEDLLSADVKSADTLLWMPNISNDEEKILPRLKQENPKLLLISSKRVIEKQYKEFEVIGRLLKSHSNLGIMVTEDEPKKFRFKLLDPLGNQYIDTNDIAELAAALSNRVREMKALTRVGSVCVDEGTVPAFDIDTAFIGTIKFFGDEFSRYVNAINPERFLGNAAARTTDRITRCCHGFPAMRAPDDHYLISRRNVDKALFSKEDFIVVTADEGKVHYFGSKKPSVDAPIQIRLLNHYGKVNYMIHGHVYIEGAPTTKHKVPCGHIEEFNEITEIFQNPDSSDFAINLKGHGCLMMASDLSYFKSVKLKARPFPEA